MARLARSWPGDGSRYSDLVVANVGLVFVQIGHGGATVLVKLTLDAGANELVLAVYRAALSVAVLVLLAYFCERKQRRRASVTAPLVGVTVACGLMGYACAPLLVNVGVSFANATMGGVGCLVIPVFTFAISVLVGQEAFRWRAREGQAKVLAVILSVCGAVTMTTVDGPEIFGGRGSTAEGRVHSDELRRLGIVCVLLSAFFYAAFFTLQRHVLARYPLPISTTAFQQLAGGVLLAVLGGLILRNPEAWMIFKNTAVVVPLMCSSVITSLNFTLQAWVVHTAGPLLVAFYSPLQTFAGGILAHVFLGETIFLGNLVGALLACAALYLITWALAKSRQAEAMLVPAGGATAGIAEPILPSVSDSLKEPLLR